MADDSGPFIDGAAFDGDSTAPHRRSPTRTRPTRSPTIRWYSGGGLDGLSDRLVRLVVVHCHAHPPAGLPDTSEVLPRLRLLSALLSYLRCSPCK